MTVTNVTSNVSGMGSQGPEDKFKVSKSAVSKYKKRNILSLVQFIRRSNKSK